MEFLSKLEDESVQLAFVTPGKLVASLLAVELRQTADVEGVGKVRSQLQGATPRLR
jgi:hypothetical protein